MHSSVTGSESSRKKSGTKLYIIQEENPCLFIVGSRTIIFTTIPMEYRDREIYYSVRHFTILGIARFRPLHLKIIPPLWIAQISYVGEVWVFSWMTHYRIFKFLWKGYILPAQHFCKFQYRSPFKITMCNALFLKKKFLMMLPITKATSNSPVLHAKLPQHLQFFHAIKMR